MKIVNPREGKCPTLEADEPFMLWCPRRKVYVRAIITRWYRHTSGYVIRDTQGPLDTTRAAFCVGADDGTNLFDRVHEASQALIRGGYIIYYM